MSGWIKLHRSLQDHFIYDFSEPDKALAWIDILLSASYADSRVKIKSQVIEVRKGQWLVSQLTLQKRWRMSQNKVKRLLKLLEKDCMIQLKTNELTSIITICNFDTFQSDERTDELPGGRPDERATDDQSNDIQRSKEVKKRRNKIINSDELDFSAWHQQPSKEILDAWLAMRKRVKASLSQQAINTIGKQINLAISSGFTVDECLAKAEVANWKGFECQWMENTRGSQNAKQAGYSPAPNKHQQLQQWSIDASARINAELELLKAEEAADHENSYREYVSSIPDVDS